MTANAFKWKLGRNLSGDSVSRAARLAEAWRQASLMDGGGRAGSWILRNKLVVCAMVPARGVRFQLAGSGP